MQTRSMKIDVKIYLLLSFWIPKSVKIVSVSLMALSNCYKILVAETVKKAEQFQYTCSYMDSTLYFSKSPALCFQTAMRI